nr:uncharacterized protein LOC117862751 isoform X2 [Setaria viridis]
MLLWRGLNALGSLYISPSFGAGAAAAAATMGSNNLSLTLVVALFSGLLILGAVVGEDECGFLCEDGTYVTCTNYPGQQFPGCSCECGPSDGHGCVVYGSDGSVATVCPR